MQIAIHECRSAEDVRRLAREIQTKRLIGRQAEKPKPEPKEPPGEIPFQILVNAAYPATYPSKETGRKSSTFEKILKATGEVFSVRRNEILSTRHQSDIVFPRQLSIALCRHFTKLSYPAIGRLFEKDHTTIIHACRKMQALIDKISSELGDSTDLLQWARMAEKLAAGMNLRNPYKNRHTPSLAKITIREVML